MLIAFSSELLVHFDILGPLRRSGVLESGLEKTSFFQGKDSMNPCRIKGRYFQERQGLWSHLNYRIKDS